MIFSNQMLSEINSKSTGRLALHNELKEYLESGGNIKEYPTGHSIWASNDGKSIKEKKLVDLEDEFDPKKNRSIEIDIQSQKNKQLSKKYSKKLPTQNSKSIIENKKIITINKTENEKKEVFLKRSIVKKESVIKVDKERKNTSSKRKKPIKITEKKPSRTTIKTLEQVEEHQRRMEITRAKKKAIAENKTFFEATCRIHKVTTYTFSKGDCNYARCVACVNKATAARRDRNKENPKSIRIRENKDNLLLAISKKLSIFIGICSTHGRSAHHVETRNFGGKVDYESRCCECKKYSKFKSEQKQKKPSPC